MKTYSAVFGGTNLDRQGERISRSALESLAEAINKSYLPMHMNHDPRVAPVGRVTSARVEAAMEEGEFLLVGDVEVWEVGDTQESLAGDGRRVMPRCGLGIAVHMDYGLFTPDRVRALRDALGPGVELKYRAKKGVGTGDMILISVGVFTIGQIASGFLQQLGQDAYHRLLALLVSWFRTAESPEALEVIAGVKVGSDPVEVHCFLPRPTPDEVASFMDSGFKSIGPLVELLMADEPRVARVFLQWDTNRWRLVYWVRDDGVPSRIEPIPAAIMEKMGMSFSGSVAIQDIETNF